MKSLVTGSAGLIGRQVVKDLTKSINQVYSCYHDSKPEFGILTLMDLTNFESIQKTVEDIKPDIIIHLAAMTNVDLCETQRDLAMKINTKATKILSKQAAKIRAYFLYVSTDYVFDGKSGMKKVNDTPNPVDFYGESKLAGERAVMDLASSWCIARTSTPFGLHPTKKSFPLWVTKNLQSKKEIQVVTDQYTSPTYVPNLSQMIIELATRQISDIIHVAGASRISRYDMAKSVAEKLNLDSNLLKTTSINDMNWTAKRPRDSSLDISKATSILKVKPISIDEGLDLFVKEIKPQFNR